jgi:Na+/proline symporter
VLWFGRVSGLFLVGLGVFLASSFDRVATALTALLGFSSIMGVVVWGGVLWRRTTAKGAWAAVGVLFALWGSLGPIGMQLEKYQWMAERLPAWVGMYGSEKVLPQLLMWYLPAGVVTLVVVSLLTRPQPKKQLDDFFMLLKTPVGQEQKLIDAGVPIVYVGTAKGNYWEERYPRLVHWGGFAAAGIVCLMVLGLLWGMARIGS